MEAIAKTLEERGARYGDFTVHADICQSLKAVVYSTGGFMEMKPDARQAVDVIFDKIARMINGDPEYDDNWRDIIGYATLVLNRILRDQNGPELPGTIMRVLSDKEYKELPANETYRYIWSYRHNGYINYYSLKAAT